MFLNYTLDYFATDTSYMFKMFMTKKISNICTLVFLHLILQGGSSECIELDLMDFIVAIDFIKIPANFGRLGLRKSH